VRIEQTQFDRLGNGGIDGKIDAAADRRRPEQ
jgi:hypothetical protein